MTGVSEIESTAVVLAPKSSVRILRPLAAPAEMLRAQNETRDFLKAVLAEGRDFGQIPGTNKATLLKPGAEKVTLAFGCSAVPRILEQEIDHDRLVPWFKQKKKYNNASRTDRSYTWQKEEGQSLGLYRYIVQVDIVDENGQIRGSGIGSCSTMESKYVDRPRDCENTVLKMAMKRGHISAVLSTFGLSEQFTADAEEAQATTEETPAEVSPLDRTWPNQEGYPWAGKKFREIPTLELGAQRTKTTRIIDRAREKGDARIADMGEVLLETIDWVLEDRRLHPENGPAEPAAPAAARPVADAKPANTSHVAAAEETRHAALDDDDDDCLPF